MSTVRQALFLFLHHAFPFLLLETDISSRVPRYENKEALSMDCPLYHNERALLLFAATKHPKWRNL